MSNKIKVKLKFPKRLVLKEEIFPDEISFVFPEPIEIYDEKGSRELIQGARARVIIREGKALPKYRLVLEKHK